MRPIFAQSLVALAAVATVAFAQGPAPPAQEPDESAAQIDALTSEVAALRLEIERLTAETTDVTERTAALEAGFTLVSKEAVALSKVLDRSEDQGFTAGINYESRVTLLSGWRRYLSVLSSAAPKTKTVAADAERR